MMLRKKAILSILSFFIIPSIVAEVMEMTNLIETDNYLVISLLIYSLIIIFIILLNYQYLREKLSQNLLKINRPFVNGIKGYFLVIFFNIILGLIISYTKIEVITPENQLGVEQIVKGYPLLLTFFVIGLIGPLCEELVFRFSLFALFIKDKKSKSFLPYLLAAIVFAIVHDQSIITNFSNESIMMFLTYFAPSLALSIVYRKTNHNLVSVFTTHMLVNTISILLIGVGY